MHPTLQRRRPPFNGHVRPLLGGLITIIVICLLPAHGTALVAGHAGAAGLPVSPILPGKLTLSATFNSIDVELKFTGDGNSHATANLDYRKTGTTAWLQALPMWRTDDGSSNPGPAFYGSALLLDPGTSYDIRVTVADPDGVLGVPFIPGTVATRPDTIQLAAALKPTHYVLVSGNDAHAGTSPATAWRTLDKALQAAPAGAVVQVGPGAYTRPKAIRESALTLVAQFPAVDDGGNVINAGQHSIVVERQVAPQARVWQSVAPDGDPTHALFVWRAAGAKISQLGYSDTQTGEPKRVGNWKPDNMLLHTPASFASTLYTNKTYNYGFWVDPTRGDLYLRLPPNAPSSNPNTLFMTAGEGTGLTLSAANVRFSGFEVSTFATALALRGSTNALVDHNLFQDNKNAVELGAQTVVQYNRVINSNLRFDPAAYQVGGIPRLFIKNWIVLADGSQYSQGRVGEQSETESISGPGSGDVIRFNTFDGNFHAIGRGASSGAGRYDGYGWDIHDNVIQHNADDAVESDGATIDWRIWNNRIQYSQSALSVGPLKYGPVYFFRNTAWEIGSNGVPREGDITKLTPGEGFKYSGASKPRGLVYVINNTLWTDDPGVPQRTGGTTGVPGGSLDAGGGGSSEAFYLRNNIFRFTRYAWNVANEQPWDEDFNAFATTDQTRGLGFHNLRFTSDVPKYRSTTGQGGHTDTFGNFITTAAIDSQLMNAKGGDLRLRDGSYFADAGVMVPNVTNSSGSAATTANEPPDIGSS